MEKFLNKQHPGLQDKLLWFYNEFIARKMAPNKNSFKQMDFYMKIRRKFPGISDISKFRNEISHGNINTNLAEFDKVIDLRIKSKDIVDNLFRIMEKSGYKIPRDKTYTQVISIIYLLEIHFQRPFFSLSKWNKSDWEPIARNA